MRATLFVLVCVFSSLGSLIGTGYAQSVDQAPKSQPASLPEPAARATLPILWFESGLGYRPGPEGELVPHLRIGFRGIQPLTDTAAIYAAFAVDGDLTLDMGGWYSFLLGADDLFGFRSYAGTGLSYVAGSFGVALSAALSYELSPETSLIIVYTHRPLFFPELGQAFDVSLGVSFTAP